uniref:Proline and serine rich coiled-coil 1 n=1 Tax=Nomascus leucogenys TaxID=61853 RepID=A0A2I3HVF5_NOMLE
MEDLEEDVRFIVDETLDFVGLSPSDRYQPLYPTYFPLTVPLCLKPLTAELLAPFIPEKLEEILDEANRLAAQLEQCALQERESAGEGLGPRRVKPSPRRETFVLKDSPVRDLLPTVNSLTRSTPSPSSLMPRLRSNDRKGSVRALRATSGKRPSNMKRESPTCNLFPAPKSPASSPLTRSTPPVRGRAGPSGRAAASEETRAAKLRVSGSGEFQRCPTSGFSVNSKRASKTKHCRTQSAGNWTQGSCFPATKSSCHGCHSQQSAAPQESGSPRTYQVKRSGQQARLQ